MPRQKKKKSKISQNEALFCFLERAFHAMAVQKIEVRNVLAKGVENVGSLQFKQGEKRLTREETVRKTNEILHALRREAIRIGKPQQYVLLVYDFLKSHLPVAKLSIDVPHGSDVNEMADPETWMVKEKPPMWHRSLEKWR